MDETRYGREASWQDMKPFARFCVAVGAAVPSKNHQVWEFRFRLWHPLTWVLAIVIFLIALAKASVEAWGEVKSELGASPSARR